MNEDTVGIVARPMLWQGEHLIHNHIRTCPCEIRHKIREEIIDATSLLSH